MTTVHRDTVRQRGGAAVSRDGLGDCDLASSPGSLHRWNPI